MFLHCYNMDKHTVIVIIASVIIAVPFIFSAWNIYAANNLQLQGPEGQFSYFEMVNDNKLIVCNPLPFFVNFERIEIVTYFEGMNKGVLSIQPTIIPPSSSLVVNGTFRSETFSEAQYLALHFDGMFSGSTPKRIDPNKMVILTEVQTPIIGVIPYSVTKQYSSMDFWNILNGKDGEFSC